MEGRVSYLEQCLDRAEKALAASFSARLNTEILLNQALYQIESGKAEEAVKTLKQCVEIVSKPV